MSTHRIAPAAEPANGTERRKRVCIFPGTLGMGGATRNMVRLAAGFARHGYEVDLFITRRSSCTEPIPDGVEVVLGGQTAKGSVLPLARYIRRRAPDAVISARTYINVVAAAAVALSRSRTTLIVTERTVGTVERRKDPKPIQRIVELLRDVAYRRADHVVGVSRSVAEDLESLGRSWASKVRVIVNPIVSSDLFRAASQPPADLWWGGGRKPMIVSVGRLTTAKDQATLLRAFARVREQLPSARLLLAGEGPLRDGLQELATDLGISDAVLMPGYLDNPYPYMRDADLFVQSSQWEGLPTVLVEAIALGTRVVATSCAGVPEVLEDGRIGTLVPVGDSVALAEGMVRELSAQRDSEELRGSAMRFHAAEVIKQYDALIDRVGS